MGKDPGEPAAGSDRAQPPAATDARGGCALVPWRALSLEWHSRAADDARVLRLGVKNRQFADAVFGFHAQQAVEKALKAVLAARGLAPPRIHDLVRLAHLVEKAGVPVPEDVWAAADLTAYATVYRYPGPEPPGKVDRAATQKIVVRVLRWAGRLAREARNGARGRL